MQRIVAALIAMLWLGLLPVLGGAAKISKVLPHLLDAEGRHTPAPSLYERDAHQAGLRQNPERIKSMRFDIRWKYSAHYMVGIRLRLEVRGSKDPKVLVMEQDIERRPWYGRWSSFELDEVATRTLGEVVAWRATLWDGDRQLAELQSFLW